jgi:hypothetical protein
MTYVDKAFELYKKMLKEGWVPECAESEAAISFTLSPYERAMYQRKVGRYNNGIGEFNQNG